MTSFYDVVIGRRTVRRFREAPIPRDLLDRCINAARLAPSASNLQPLEYIVVDDPALLPKACETVKWAGYLRPNGDPPEGHRPTAYIYVLRDAKNNSPWAAYDVGEAVENISLVAQAEGVGSCQFGSVDRDKVRQLFSIPDRLEVTLALALGYIDETHAVEPYTGDPKYWRDKQGVHHVPKRSLENIRHWNGL